MGFKLINKNELNVLKACLVGFGVALIVIWISRFPQDDTARYIESLKIIALFLAICYGVIQRIGRRKSEGEKQKIQKNQNYIHNRGITYQQNNYYNFDPAKMKGFIDGAVAASGSASADRENIDFTKFDDRPDIDLT